METNSTSNKSGRGCNTLASKVSNAIANFFERLGFHIALHPWNTIIVCLLTVTCCCVGFIKFHNEKNPLKLWIPQNSQFLDTTNWLMEKFGEFHRLQSVLITAPNVLEPEILVKLAHINQAVVDFKVRLNGTEAEDHRFIGWPDVCFKIPMIANITRDNPRRRRRRRDITFEEEVGTSFDFDDDTFESQFDNTKVLRPFEPSIDLDPKLYCKLINDLPMGCYQQNILELWQYNVSVIERLTKQDILRDLNRTVISPTTGHSVDLVSLLGGIERNEDGLIVGARALQSHWTLYVNLSEVDLEKVGNIAGTEDWTTEEAFNWEAEFLNLLQVLQRVHRTDDIQITYSAGRSYGDISAATMFQDIDKLVIGNILMFIYMQLVLSKFSWVEMRFTLGSVGLLTVGMAFVSACGICSVLGVSYGPVHTSLPFMLLGLGVDDMFVMAACWKKIQSTAGGLSHPEQFGLMLKSAGASITVTSLTDIVAFLVGSSTILPSLKSFCIYATVGILMTYIYSVTFFVAVFSLDERRIVAKRNAILPCIKHENATIWCAPNIMKRGLEFLYKRLILTKPGKTIVIITVIALAAVSGESIRRLKQKFDPSWFIPDSTYLHSYLENVKTYFPDQGYDASVYMGKLNYSSELPKILNIVEQIENRTDVLHKVNSWTGPFHSFVKTYFEKDIHEDELSDDQFHMYLSKFLFSSSGGKYQRDFLFENKSQCGQPVPPVLVATIRFTFRSLKDRDDYVPAMHSIEHIVEQANFQTGDRFATAWAKIFGNWITDEVIDVEVMRNIGYAMVCVMICTAVLIVDLQICFWIFVCITLTLLNVCGFMQRWGLTIDLVSCIGLQLAVGLCVDYAAHIGHTFLTMRDGDRNKRALETVLHIGSAVLYGGGSTLLALAMLSESEAYTFQAFFKIFLLVIIFGLFYGVVFFPVVLSIIGPQPYLNLSPTKHKFDENGTEMLTISNGEYVTNDKPRLYSNDFKSKDEIEQLTAEQQLTK